MLGVGQCIFTSNVKFVKFNVVEKHIDAAQVVSSNIDFLSIETISNCITPQHLFCF